MKRLVLAFILLAIALPLCAQNAPVLFFSDLTSGPNSGGENGKGAFVTIYGNHFGATQGTSTVTVGCGSVDSYKLWSDKKIIVQLGGNAKTGDIVVTVPSVGASNGIPFTVRAGNIFFLNGANGDTFNATKKQMHPGDILYVRAGTYTSADQYGAVFAATLAGGTADTPYAIVAYPGETVTLGQDTASTPTSTAILGPSIAGGPFSGYVIAGFNLRGFDSAINIKAPLTGTNTEWRVVGNDMQCQSGSTPGGSACFEATYATQHITMLGNYVHDVSTAVPTSQYLKLYHAVYFGGSYLDVGWNTIARVQSCRGFQTHATGGPDQHDIFFHDNVVHDVRCDCVNLSTVNPAIGPVIGYNNVLYGCGQGPDPSGQIANYACVYDGGGTDNVPSPSDPPRGGNIQWLNNTMADCGGAVSAGNEGGVVTAIASNKAVPILLRNNVMVQKLGEVYVFDVAANGGVPSVTGDNNLFFGVGLPPSVLTNNLNLDPLFATPFSDFNLQAGSPAINAGVAVSITRDINGSPRVQGGKPDLGAIESNGTPPALTPPKSAAAVAH